MLQENLLSGKLRDLDLILLLGVEHPNNLLFLLPPHFFENIELLFEGLIGIEQHLDVILVFDHESLCLHSG